MKKASCRRHTDLFYKFLNAVETASVRRGHSGGKKRQEHCGWRERGARGNVKKEVGPQELGESREGWHSAAAPLLEEAE